MTRSLALACVLAMLLSVGATAAPPPRIQAGAESHTPDPCGNPGAEPLCAPTPPPGSAACRAAAVVIRPVPTVAQSTPSAVATWPQGPVHAEEHLLDLPLLGSHAKVLDGTCDASANPGLEACGAADVEDLHLDLHAVAIPLLITADSLREKGCSTGLGGGNGATIANLRIKPDFSNEIHLPLVVGHTYVGLGALGYVSINEAYASAGACQRNTGSALHLKLAVPIVEVYVSWVSTVACRFPPALHTTSDPTGGPFAAPVTARDTATVAGPGPLPTGAVSFALCAPAQVDASGCPAGSGTPVGTQALVGGVATSAEHTTPASPGKYCWRAAYGGDAWYLPATHTNPGSECFALKVHPTIATTSMPTGNTFPTVAASDKATVSGPPAAPAPTGTVSFVLCRPSEVTAEGCPAGAGIAAGSPALVGGTATSAAVGGAATAELGKYCWRAHYAGDANYFPADHTNPGSECFTTAKQVATIGTTSNPTGNAFVGQTAKDTATLTGPGGVPLPTGAVRFFLCSPTAGTIVPQQGCTAGGTDLGQQALAGGAATSASTGALADPGVYCWRAEYGGDAVYDPASHTNYVSECFTLVKRTPSVETRARWNDPAHQGKNYDRAWVNATGGGPVPKGDVSFYLCGPFNVPTACNAGGVFNGTRTLSGVAGASVDSDKFSGGLAHQKYYCYRAEYGGDANYIAAKHTNDSTECFQNFNAQ